MLPGPTFVKSFLRTYAEFLGLDPHLLVEEYRARHDPRDESELTPFARAPSGRQRRRRPPRRPAWLPVAAAVVGILALLLVVGLFGSNSSDDGSNSPTPTTATKSKQQSAAAKKRAEERKRRREERARQRAAARARVKLRIVPAAATYVCVDKGVGTPIVYEGTLSAPKSWTAKHLRINLGRRGVRITVNGKQVKVPAGSDPIGFDFRPTRHSVITGTRPCG
jgi:cytoskeletal protein RodZ